MTTTTDFEKLFSIMLQLGKLMSQQTQESHEEKVATMLQFSVLQFLMDRPNSTVTDLCKSLSLSKSSATQLIERLVKSRLVGRFDDAADRRITRLCLTEKGEKQFATIKKKIKDKMHIIFSKVPTNDLRELIRIHTNLIESNKKGQ